MKDRKHNEPTIVTPEDDKRWLEQLENEDASNALAQERWYELDAWNREQHRQAREAVQRAQGVAYVPLM